MPKKSEPRKLGTSEINGVQVSLLELDAKTGKEGSTDFLKFTYQFPEFSQGVTPEQLKTALTYTKSDKTVVDGWTVAVGYINDAIKNEKRGSKLAEMKSALDLRADPEATIAKLIDMMVIGMGVSREVAEANVRTTVGLGTVAPAK